MQSISWKVSPLTVSILKEFHSAQNLASTHAWITELRYMGINSMHMIDFTQCHGTTSLLPFLVSFSLCLCPAPSLSPSESIRPHLPAFCSHPPAFCHLHSNSKVYSCNYATSALGLASD